MILPQFYLEVAVNNLTVKLGHFATFTSYEVVPAPMNFFYKLNSKWSTGLHYEWVRDEDGARIAGIGNVVLPVHGWDGKPGFTGSFHDLSLA